MPMKTAMQQLQEDDLGRKVLALTSQSPVLSATGTVTFDQGSDAEIYLAVAAIVVDVKVLNGDGFNAGTTNELFIQVGSSTLYGGGLKTTFAKVADATPSTWGAVVTGVDIVGADTPQFMPQPIPEGSSVFVGYSQSGTAATLGEAIVVVSYVPLPA